MKKPQKIVMLGITYKIIYCATMAEVDKTGNEELKGRIDSREMTIRVWDGGRPPLEIMIDLMHEIMHAIAWEMGGPMAKERHHDDLNRMATTIVDTLQRNGLLNLWRK